MEKQPFNELLKTYKIRLKNVLVILDDCTNELDRIRVRSQIACYRTFIIELEEAMQ